MFETATATKWVIDPMHSEVQFKIKHLVISTITGSLKSFQGSIQAEGDTVRECQRGIHA